MRPEHQRLIHDSSKNNPRHRLGFEPNLDITRRNIVDPAMQGVRAVAIGARWPHRLQAAARNPFTETVQPAKTAAFRQVHELWMDNFRHRRVPSQPQITDLSRPEMKSARW